ncbi:uncharacterized protein [Periplaneta americana]|uniref:uncharacterized protein n=1 Tax=Periplaneta americana TaxID=6978 RepID=UPI0037E93CB4
MFAKPMSIALLGFVFIQILNVGRSQLPRVPVLGAANKLLVKAATDDICAIPDQLQPMLPWANALAKQLNDSANDAVLLRQQLIEGCNGLKANNFPKQDKEALAARLQSFGKNSKDILKQMGQLVKDGGKIVAAFFHVAVDLNALSKEEL